MPRPEKESQNVCVFKIISVDFTGEKKPQPNEGV